MHEWYKMKEYTKPYVKKSHKRDKDSQTVRLAQCNLISINFHNLNLFPTYKGVYETGLEYWNKAIHNKKDEPALYINRGDCLLRLGEYPLALVDFEVRANLRQYTLYLGGL